MSTTSVMMMWPELPLAAWADTYETLHRWTQIVGKTRLRLAPMQNHWWNVTLSLTARGLTTSPMPYQGREVEIDFDFIDHTLVARASDGREVAMPLEAQSVAAFYREYQHLLRELDVDVRIWPVPMELKDCLRFDDDEVHRTYDADAAHRCWRVMAESDQIFKAFRGQFLGKSSPSHFWWGGFDLACTRFSGRRAPLHPGGIPNCPDYVTREAYSHECISVGWWPGTVGGMSEPAFYAYAYPEPPGCPEARIEPDGAYYSMALREWLLPYQAVRESTDPQARVMEFCESTYGVAADLGHWDRAALERPATREP